MRTFRLRTHMLIYGVLAGAALIVLGVGAATAAYDQSDQGYQDQGQGSSAVSTAENRDLGLEQQIASELRRQGYGAQGEIMILATGNDVTLLGIVPSDQQKTGAENIAKGVAAGKQIDNRLHVQSQTKPVTGAALESDIYNNLGGDIRKDVKVSVQGGTANLQGHLNDWSQVADAIDAAFAAGASRVNSRFTVGTAGTGTTAQAAGGASAYGYVPGQQGGAAGAGYASPSDLALAQHVAGQLRQQLRGQNIQLIQPQSIYIMASQGTVTLSGYVLNSNEKLQAAQIAHAIPGVRTVTNDITILSPGGAGAQAGGPGAQSGWQGQSAQDGWQGQGAQGGQQGFGAQGTPYQPYSPGQTGQMGGAQQGSGEQAPYGQGGYYGPQGYMPGQAGQGAGAQQGFDGQSQYGQAGQMGGAQTGSGASDLALAQQIAMQLRQRLPNIRNIQVMRPGTIYVMAVNGDVILHGSVANQNIKQRANQIANAIPGVQKVTDTLHVLGGGAAGAPSPYGYIPGQGEQGAGQQGAAGQGMSGQGAGQEGAADQDASAQTQYIAAQRGQAAADMAIAQQVAQSLHQRTGQNVLIEIPGTIYVKVANGTVTLDGFVPNNSMKQHAEQVAKSIRGVRSVKNSLNIGPAGSGQAYGYMPPSERQFGNQPYWNPPYGSQ